MSPIFLILIMKANAFGLQFLLRDKCNFCQKVVSVENFTKLIMYLLYL